MTSRKSLLLLFWGLYLIQNLDYTNSLKTNSKGNRKPTTRPASSKTEETLNLKESQNESNSTEVHLTSRILQIKNTALRKDFIVISKPSNSDVIVGSDVAKDARIIMECSSPLYPVQWIYAGQGMPEISTNTSIKTSKKSKNSGQFTATAALGFNRNLQESDTGEYICRSVQNPEDSIFYYIFVPGKSLFTSTNGHVIKFHDSQNFLQIPCSVTHPDVLVTMQKKSDGLLQCLVSTFSPKTGFSVNVAKAMINGYGVPDDPSGEYVCIAGLNGSFQLLEYSVKRIAGEEVFLSTYSERDFEELDDDDSLEAYGIIPRDEGQCFRNPCGPNSICRTNYGNKLPVCRCKFGYTGSPPNCQLENRSVCSPTPCGPNSRCQEVPGKNGNLAHCSCLPNYIGRPPSCRPECLLNLDCPLATACINQQCEDPCDGYCGKGAICNVRDHEPVCSCPPGYSGDPNKFGKCGRSRTPSPNYFPPQSQHPSRPGYPNDPKPNPEVNFACHPWPCGPFSECRPVTTDVGQNAECTCAPGYIGFPPNCHPECRKDSDCSNNRGCIESKCRDPCLFSRLECGENAVCYPVNHQPECQCLAGFYGNPNVKCTNKHNSGGQNNNQHQGQGQGPINSQFPESSSSSSDEYPSQPPPMRPVIVGGGYPGAKPSDKFRPTVQPTNRPKNPNNNANPDFPCRKSPCGKDAICSFRNQTVGCKCPAELTGFGSDPYVECLPSNNPCEICGPNSECRIRKNRRPVCSCLIGKSGSPPNCRDSIIYCQRHSDCPQSLACHREKECVDLCRGADCGKNAVCRGVNHQPVCACPNHPGKDPLYGCPSTAVPGNGNKYPLGANYEENFDY